MFVFLEQFSRSFLLAMVFWPIAAWLLTLPILLVQYVRYHHLERKHIAAIYLGILYLLGLATFTLYPMPDNPAEFCAAYHLTPQLNPLQFITDIQHDGLRAILQVVMNIVFFVPLGIFLRNVFARRLGITLLIALLMSLLVETAQLTGAFGFYPCSYRLFDVDDLLFNTMGAGIGYWLGSLLPNLSHPGRRRGVNTDAGPLQRLVTFVTDLILSNVIAFLLIIPVYLFGGRDGIWHHFQLPVFITVFFVLQLIVPLLWNGRTIAARFTGISLDDRERTPLWRFVFYLVRALLLASFVFTDLTGRVGIAIGFATLAWYLFNNRKMPYTLVDKIFEHRSTVAQSSAH